MSKKATIRDNYYTPPVALEALYPYINKESRIWEPAAGDGFLSNALSSKGFNVTSTDIKTGICFLTSEPPEYDIMITNPPFSLKTEFLNRAFSLGKPFAMLLNIDSLGGKGRQKLFKQYGIQLIMLGGRLHFQTPHLKTSTPNFETAWFCWQMKLPEQLNFITLASYK